MKNSENHNKNRMFDGVAGMLDSAVRQLIARELIGKRAEFAEMIGMTENVLNKKLQGISPIDWVEFQKMFHVIAKLDPEYTFVWLARFVFGDLTLGIKVKEAA